MTAPTSRNGAIPARHFLDLSDIPSSDLRHIPMSQRASGLPARKARSRPNVRSPAKCSP